MQHRASNLNEDQLIPEIKKIHERHGTSEYSFLINEIKTLREMYPNDTLPVVFSSAIKEYRIARKNTLTLYPTVAETLLRIKGRGAYIVGYTESMAFYSNYRMRKLGLDGVLDFVFSPADHDIPSGLTKDEIRRFPASHYEFRYTRHKHTPHGELKPNPKILQDIIYEVGGNQETTVYVGDSLVKDISMAQSAGVYDVWAKYGQSHKKEEYELLKKVTHWTQKMVEKEAATGREHITPTFTLEKTFSEILDFFEFREHEDCNGET